jgi:hypothetical protein
MTKVLKVADLGNAEEICQHQASICLQWNIGCVCLFICLL